MNTGGGVSLDSSQGAFSHIMVKKYDLVGIPALASLISIIWLAGKLRSISVIKFH